jgi:hypothetical protein
VPRHGLDLAANASERDSDYGEKLRNLGSITFRRKARYPELPHASLITPFSTKLAHAERMEGQQR